MSFPFQAVCASQISDFRSFLEHFKATGEECVEFATKLGDSTADDLQLLAGIADEDVVTAPNATSFNLLRAWRHQLRYPPLQHGSGPSSTTCVYGRVGRCTDSC
eukprot:TRINITY_DN33511_c0_g1_i1.p2 TRINITY_DN33511_c0_g1~~TRINITY_DN33511_c0_g1_i1.p2  ORF type:complete len:104 (+),score=10.33 TRINITY_DN33511_c0_g1_i1:385-696(+)